jgi:hypothetical protein
MIEFISIKIILPGGGLSHAQNYRLNAYYCQLLLAKFSLFCTTSPTYPGSSDVEIYIGLTMATMNMHSSERLKERCEQLQRVFYWFFQRSSTWKIEAYEPTLQISAPGRSSVSFESNLNLIRTEGLNCFYGPLTSLDELLTSSKEEDRELACLLLTLEIPKLKSAYEAERLIPEDLKPSSC